MVWITGAPQVPELAGKRFYHYAFERLTLAALATGEALITTDRAFWAVLLLGQASQAGVASFGSFRMQLLDQGVRDDRLDRHFFQNKGLNQLGVCNVGAGPWMNPVPHYIPPNHPVALRVTNMANAQNVVDVSLFGYVSAPLVGFHVDDGGIPSDEATDRNVPPNLLTE